MFYNIVLTYAKFRHNHKGIGRLIELSMIMIMVAACITITMTTEISIMLAALGVITFCGVSFLFFKKADYYRRLMPI